MLKPRIIPSAILIIIPALFIIKLSALPYAFYEKDDALLQIAFQHAGDRLSDFDEGAYLRKQGEAYRKSLKEKKGAKMDLDIKANNYSRERYPVEITVFIDGKEMHKKIFLPSGAKRDADCIVFDTIKLSPGMHGIKIVMRDSMKEEKAPYGFEDTVEFKPADVKVITFDKNAGGLKWSNKMNLVLSGGEDSKF